MSYSRTKLKNKSRPNKVFVGVDSDKKSPYKRKKRNANPKTSRFKKRITESAQLQKQNKYVPGDFIYDTKGQKAEIKYVGQCHKGSGTWFGIEFVDGSLGKHNGTINAKTYFKGAPRRCDMIRLDKIRRKTFMQKTSQCRKPRTRRKRAVSEKFHTQSMSLTDLSNGFTTRTVKKRNRKPTHKRMTSQPSQLSSLSATCTKTVNDLYFDRHQQDRNMFLFGDKCREEKTYQGKAIQKQRYKGNKYILARDKATEKRKHKRVDQIKTCKKRVQKQKHERNTSKIQQILKRKELKKEEMLRLMEENKTKELQRIKTAKQKSKRCLNRARSTPISCSNNAFKNGGKYESFDDLTPETNNNYIVDDMMNTDCSVDGTLKKNDFCVDTLQPPPSQSILVSPYSYSDLLMPFKSPMSARPAMFPSVSSDSALLLQEMLDRPMSELISSDDECASEDSLFNIESDDSSDKAMPMQTTSDRTFSMIELSKTTLPSAQTQPENEFHVPMSSGYRSKSNTDALPPRVPMLRHAQSAPIIINDEKGTDYWIKQYNKANKRRKSKAKKKTKSSLKRTGTPKLKIINPKLYTEDESDMLINDGSLSPPFICDNISDIASLCSSLTPSPPQYSRSAGSTPLGNTPTETVEPPSNCFNCASNNNNSQSKHGEYPFARTRSAYINKRFTGIVRIGHRYLLRDGRVGVVRYIDSTLFGVGTWIGFELDKPEGEHNGSVSHVKYFECDAMYGTFVKKSQIAQCIGRDTIKSLSTRHLRCLNVVT
eukprot:333562_1